MRTHTGKIQTILRHHVAYHTRMRIETEGRGESILRAQRRAVVVVGQVGIVEAKLPDQFKLPAHTGERLNESEATDFHFAKIHGILPLVVHPLPAVNIEHEVRDSVRLLGPGQGKPTAFRAYKSRS